MTWEAVRPFEYGSPGSLSLITIGEVRLFLVIARSLGPRPAGPPPPGGPPPTHRRPRSLPGCPRTPPRPLAGRPGGPPRPTRPPSARRGEHQTPGRPRGRPPAGAGPRDGGSSRRRGIGRSPRDG